MRMEIYLYISLNVLNIQCSILLKPFMANILSVYIFILDNNVTYLVKRSTARAVFLTNRMVYEFAVV